VSWRSDHRDSKYGYLCPSTAWDVDTKARPSSNLDRPPFGLVTGSLVSIVGGRDFRGAYAMVNMGSAMQNGKVWVHDEAQLKKWFNCARRKDMISPFPEDALKLDCYPRMGDRIIDRCV